MRPTALFRYRTTWLFLVSALLSPALAAAQLVPPGYHVETLASGLDAPCAFDFMPDGGVLFTEQNTGRVRLLRASGGVQATPVLSVAGVAGGGERGLLGIAFDRLSPSRPYLFVLHSATAPSRTRISRYTLNAEAYAGGGDLIADPATRFDLLAAIPDAASNHNGGTLRFASDGTLIASLGDDAFPCGAQDSTGLRGVILRLSVNQLGPGPGVASIEQLTPLDNPYASSPDSNARLVLARGLRNPFRVQSDPVLPWLYIGDVGDTQREEFDLLALPSVGTLPPGMARPGANFGWPYLEGTVVGAHANECAAAPDSLVAPAYEYDRTSQSFGAAIIPAGYVFAVVTLETAIQPQSGLPPGMYLSDYYSGALTRLDLLPGASQWQVAPPVPGQPNAAHFGEGFAEISDWRVDGQSLWFVRQSQGFAARTGSIGRLSALPLPPPPPPPVFPLELRVLDSPAAGSARFLFPSGVASPARLTLYDLRGRLVRRWGDRDVGNIPSGRFLTWDGLDGDGRRVTPGLYVVRLESAGRTVTARVTFLR